jgi:Zn-finger nucleic acid-binding protein
MELNTIARTQAAQLKALDALFTSNQQSPKPKGSGQCPKCHVALFEFEFPHSPGIKPNGCPQCKGIWMDDGQLQAMYSRIIILQLEQSAPAQPTNAQRASNANALQFQDMRQKARHASGFLSSIECPECGRPNPSVSFACWACGAKLNKNRTPLCPRCDVALGAKTIFGVTVDVCPNCTGLWLKKDGLTTLIKHRPDELHDLDETLRPAGTQVSTQWDDDDVALCPDCCIQMQENPSAYQSGISVNFCTKCEGVWIAHGKLKLISLHYYKIRSQSKVRA